MTFRRAMPSPAAGRAVLLALAALGAVACSSSHGTSSSDNPAISPPAPTSAPAGATTTTRPLAVTVYDCGAGAFRPPRLLVACRNLGVPASEAGVVSVTDVAWSTWTNSGAIGSGNAAYLTAGRDGTGTSYPAHLSLSGVVQTSQGPEFSQLTVNWSGQSPDGHPTDHYTLPVAPAR